MSLSQKNKVTDDLKDKQNNRITPAPTKKQQLAFIKPVILGQSLATFIKQWP